MQRMLYMLLSSLLVGVLFVGCSLNHSNQESVNKTSGSSTSWSDEKVTECNFEQGELVTFSYESKINSGELSIQLLNSQKELVQEFETNKEGKMEKEITESGTYYISIKGNEFNGNFSVEW